MKSVVWRAVAYGTACVVGGAIVYTQGNSTTQSPTTQPPNPLQAQIELGADFVVELPDGDFLVVKVGAIGAGQRRVRRRRAQDRLGSTRGLVALAGPSQLLEQASPLWREVGDAMRKIGHRHTRPRCRPMAAWLLASRPSTPAALAASGASSVR